MSIRKAVALSILLCVSGAAGAYDCLVDGETTTLTGKVWRETFPGPPNYESIEAGDRPETYWILTTEEAFCGEALSFESGDTYRIPGELTRFQLVLDRDQYADNQSLVFDNATVTGSLFTGHTGHHHTSMLIDVESIEAAHE